MLATGWSIFRILACYFWAANHRTHKLFFVRYASETENLLTFIHTRQTAIILSME